MQFENPITIEEALDRIHRRVYVLPAIQREFVWKPLQIERLFDSLMREYPIGAFLFWEIKPEHSGNYRYFEFVTKYSVREPHNKEVTVPAERSVTAILDGQQRLTAFNIALHGSYATKLPRKRWADPTAFPSRYLYLDLLYRNDDPGSEETMYEFSFLTRDEAERAGADKHWFRVSDVLGMATGPEVHHYLRKNKLADHETAFDTLWKLHQLIREKPAINFYLERSGQLDKVLNVFIRVNSGGTVLSYSDLLLSVATAKWSIDARTEIHGLVDQMNEIGWGFRFSKDRVLKASLVLCDFPDIKFKVDNFNVKNMLKIEKQWSEISNALLVAVQLLYEFGLYGENLTGENVLVPVAYYIQHRGLDDRYVTASRHASDRELIRSFVLRSLLRAGFWTGAVDSILIEARRTIQKHGHSGFPLEELEEGFRSQAKSLKFEDEEIENLLETKYQNRGVSLLLTLLYPGVDVGKEYHQDHVFPKSRFRQRKLIQAGVPPDEIALMMDRADRLPNLQLLEGSGNRTKGTMLPAEYVRTMVPAKRRRHYLEFHDLDPLPEDERGFLEFCDRRREVMLERLKTLLS